MLGLRHLPLKYRLPLIHGALNLLARAKASGWAKAVPHGLAKGPFVVSAFFNETTGVAQGGRLSANAFRAAGYDLIEHDIRPCFKHYISEGAELPGRGGVWYIHANAPEVLVALMAHEPAQWADRYRIAYWAWETPKAPRDWIRIADYLHEIWVPSRFVHDALVATFNDALRADLIPRLRVMPHPVPLPPPARHALSRARFGLSDELCEVLCLFDTKSSAARKNPWGVLIAWQEAFPEENPVARLTVKVSDLSDDRATERRLLAIAAARSDIRVMSDRLSEADMEAYIGAFDILVSLHRAEGFGLTLAEAMAAGVAVIATDWSGNIDFMTPENSRLIKSSLIPVSDPEGGYSIVKREPMQVWADPHIFEAVTDLRHLTDQPALRKALGEAGAQAIRDLHIPWRRDELADLPFNAFLQTSTDE
jgi:glycosyltransferase involved in cell wall biosynthesis